MIIFSNDFQVCPISKGYDFDGFATHFGPRIDPIFGSFRASFWSNFGSIFGSPSGGHLERKHKEIKGVWSFSAPRKGLFLEPFWSHTRLTFWYLFGSFLGQFWGLLGPDSIYRILASPQKKRFRKKEIIDIILLNDWLRAQKKKNSVQLFY